MIRGIAFLATLIVVSAVAADMPPIPQGKGDVCVAPTDVMRRDHMDMLEHQRDRTVYAGIRTKQHSLNNCVACHVQTNAANEYIPIDAPGQFCEVCHTFSSVKLDCFECHATQPDGAPEHAGIDAGSAEFFARSFRKPTGTDLKSVPGNYQRGQISNLSPELN